MNNLQYYHVFGITTIEDIGVSVYIYINTYTDVSIAKREVEFMNGTIFLFSTTESDIRQYETIGPIDVELYTKKNGWRPKKISNRPLV